MSTLSIALVLLLQSLTNPAAQSGTIEGKLTKAGGAPAPGVRVTAMSFSDGSLISFAQTDDAGRFQLLDVPQGRYYIAAGAVATPAFFPGVSSRDAAVVITVATGARVEGVDFSLAPNGTIAGTLSRVDGTPSAGSEVVVMSASNRMTPFRVGTPTAIGETDARGRFTFTNIPLGRYTVSSGGRSARSFFPGVFFEDEAGVITIGPGTVFENADFNLAGSGTRIRGRVTGAEKLADDFRSALEINVKAQRPGGWISQTNWPVDSSGQFEIKGAPPGEYAVYLHPSAGPSVSQVVKVERNDVDGIEFPAPRFVRGRVTVDDGSLLPVSPYIEVATRLVSVKARSSDGRFFISVTDPVTTVSVAELPLGYEVKEIRYGSIDIKGKPFAFPASLSEELAVVLVRH